MKLSLALTTLLLSSTAFANSLAIECFDETNTKLFSINSAHRVGTLVTWADGTSQPANYTQTESVSTTGCFDSHSLGLKMEHAFLPGAFDIEIVSQWSEGQEMTRCAGSGFAGLFEGTVSKEGKTTAIVCKDLNGLSL